MAEVTFSMVSSWLKIEEGSLEDLRRELKKQPMREAVVLSKIEVEQKTLSDIEHELRVKKYALEKKVAEKVVNYKTIENPKSQAAIDNYRKYDLELDPDIVNLRTAILDLQRKRDEQAEYVNTWKSLFQLLKEKTMILMSDIKAELAIQGTNSLTEAI